MSRSSPVRTGIVLVSAIGLSMIFLSVSGCGRNDESIALPETPVLSGQNRFVLAIDEYVRVYATPDRSSQIISHLRQGDVVAVESRTPDEAWVEVRQLALQGWIERNGVRSFSSREQALNARRLLDS